jgi:hypothetical protein
MTIRRSRRRFHRRRRARARQREYTCPRPQVGPIPSVRAATRREFHPSLGRKTARRMLPSFAEGEAMSAPSSSSVTASPRLRSMPPACPSERRSPAPPAPEEPLVPSRPSSPSPGVGRSALLRRSPLSDLASRSDGERGGGAPRGRLSTHEEGKRQRARKRRPAPSASQLTESARRSKRSPSPRPRSKRSRSTPSRRRNNQPRRGDVADCRPSQQHPHGRAREPAAGGACALGRRTPACVSSKAPHRRGLRASRMSRPSCSLAPSRRGLLSTPQPAPKRTRCRVCGGACATRRLPAFAPSAQRSDRRGRRRTRSPARSP